MGFIRSFSDMLHGMFMDGWFGVIVGLIIIAVLLAVVGFILWGVFYAIDSWFQPLQKSHGVIDGRDVTPAHTTMITIPTSNGGVATVPQYIPESWHIGVRVGHRHSWMGCSKYTYDNYRNGQKIIATYKRGRLSGRMYVQAISSV